MPPRVSKGPNARMVRLLQGFLSIVGRNVGQKLYGAFRYLEMRRRFSIVEDPSAARRPGVRHVSCDFLNFESRPTIMLFGILNYPPRPAGPGTVMSLVIF